MLTNGPLTPRPVSLGRVSFTPTPYDWVPLAVIVLLIVAIFVRVYVIGDRRISHRSGRRTAHPPEHGTAHHAGHMSEQGGNHGNKTASTRHRTGRGRRKSHHH